MYDKLKCGIDLGYYEILNVVDLRANKNSSHINPWCRLSLPPRFYHIIFLQFTHLDTKY